MMPSVTPTAVDSTKLSQDTCPATSVEESSGAFAATVEQLLQGMPAALPPELPSQPARGEQSADVGFGEDDVLATPIEAIDWLLGQCVDPVSIPAQPDNSSSMTGDAPSVFSMGWGGAVATLARLPAVHGTAESSDDRPVTASGVGLGETARASAPGNVTDLRSALSSSLLEDVLRTSADAAGDESDAPPMASVEGDASATQTAVPQAPGAVSRTEVAPRVVTAALHTPVGTPAWNDELATKLTWLIDRGEQLASIRVTPDSLGPIDIRIAVREGEASIWFGANQSDTRQAIEQAIPRLREMLASQGLSLTDAGVFQQAPRDPQRALLRHDLQRAARESGDGAPATALATGLRLPRGLVDDYA